MTVRTEREHFLVVEDLGPDGFDRWVEHKPDCPKEIVGLGPRVGQYIEVFACGTGYWETWYGFDDLKDDPRFSTPGRHEISFYSYTPQSSFEDAEAYLEFVG